MRTLYHVTPGLYPPVMLLMDRENLMVAGWSHVLSSTNDLAELDALRLRVGAPRQAFHLGDGGRPHLDLKLEPRDRALRDPEVRVFETTRDLLRFWLGCQRRDASPISGGDS